VLTKVIAFPFVAADTLLTLALGFVTLILFALITGIDLLVKKISNAFTKENKETNKEAVLDDTEKQISNSLSPSLTPV